MSSILEKLLSKINFADVRENKVIDISVAQIVLSILSSIGIG